MKSEWKKNKQWKERRDGGGERAERRGRKEGGTGGGRDQEREWKMKGKERNEEEDEVTEKRREVSGIKK